jgi:ATP-dependent DNA ligase
MDAAETAAQIMASELKWDGARLATELDEYRRDVVSTLAFKIKA